MLMAPLNISIFVVKCFLFVLHLPIKSDHGFHTTSFICSDLILLSLPRILYYHPFSYWALLRITTHYYIFETLYTLWCADFFWSMCHMSYNASTLWYTWCILLLVIQLFTLSVWGLGLLWIEIWPGKPNYQMYFH